jgi:copper chaperone CopZ
MSITATYAVDGMTCDHCVRAITAEITALPDVLSVGVDLASGVVTLTSTHPLQPHAVRDAVAEAGYALR